MGMSANANEGGWMIEGQVGVVLMIQGCFSSSGVWEAVNMRWRGFTASLIFSHISSPDSTVADTPEISAVSQVEPLNLHP